MVVFIDGAGAGTVNYNQCRGSAGNPVPAGVYCDDDVANVFGNATPQPAFVERTSNPTRFRNLDTGRAAIGSFMIDTTLLANGRHSLARGVTDSAGRPEGIGSRDFIVLNGGSLTASRAASRTAVDAAAMIIGRAVDLKGLPVSDKPMWGRTGFDLARPWEEIAPDSAGVRHITLPELGRLELRLAQAPTVGHLKANGNLRALPPGSRLDTATGVFTWGPLVGYIGAYDLVFLDGNLQVPLTVTIVPQTQLD